MYWFFIFFELFCLFFLSKQLTKSLSHFLQLLQFNQQFIIMTIAIIFLPGTIVHELSHWLMAHLLFVRTGPISLIPQLQNNTLRMGSVQVAKVDRLRQLLIGLAPLLFSLSILFFLFNQLIPRINHFSYWIIVLLVYSVFVLSNSMFSSRKDTEGAVFLLILVLLVLVSLYMFNAQLLILATQTSLSLIPTNYLFLALMYIAVPLLLDIVIILVLTLCIRWLR